MAIITPAAFAWALIPSAAGGWLLLLTLSVAGCWQAFARRRPLVDLGDAPPVSDEPQPASPTRRVFGRRRT
jgi:hypothetical protein